MQTLLIAGFGDIARRAVPELRKRWRLLALVRSSQQMQTARDLGVIPILADLDQRASLHKLSGLVDALLYTAPPPPTGTQDSRLLKLVSALAKTNSIPQRLVYISTSGVYGNRDGAWLDECATPRPQTARAQRRLAAEQLLRSLARRWPISVTILRAPGIYAENRLPLERLQNGTPLPIASQDVFVNHIHADDLAAICIRALQRHGGVRIYNACDDLPLLSGDWFGALAQKFSLPQPPRLERSALLQALSPVQASFLLESRRLHNTRIKRELGIKLQHPDVGVFLGRLGQTLALDAKIG